MKIVYTLLFFFNYFLLMLFLKTLKKGGFNTAKSAKSAVIIIV